MYSAAEQLALARAVQIMKTDSEIMNTGFESIFSSIGMVDAQRFIALLKRDKFDYTEWQWKLWPDETVESLSEKAQQSWDK